MSDTLGSIRSEILGWLRGDYADADDQPTVNGSINDALEEIWASMMRVQLARFFGSDAPVTFTVNAGQERFQLTSIADPTLAPVAATIGGGALAGRTYKLYYTFVTESGSETNLSPLTTLVVGANNLAQITAPAEPTTGAFGWNVYAGVNNVALQNQQPLPFSMINFTEPVTGFLDYPDAQQAPPTSNQTADNIAWIVHLEIITTDTLRRSWNQYDIDSEIMRRYARTLSSASEYQTYVWDLINGRTIEIRPPLGLTFSPRYFFVAKPRRLRYDQAEIPYVSTAGVHQFLIDRSISRLKLGVDEYIARRAWSESADKQELKIQKALLAENWAKNTRVQPHLF